MNCREAKTDIALWVGEDLAVPAQREELRRHLSVCPECRSQARRLKSALRVLEAADQDRTYDAADSLWPELANRIQNRAGRDAPSSRFNGWVPLVAATAAAALLVVVLDQQPPAQQFPVQTTPIARDVWGAPQLWTAPERGAQNPFAQRRLDVLSQPTTSEILERDQQRRDNARERGAF
jgi:hypothetical protein